MIDTLRLADRHLLSVRCWCADLASVWTLLVADCRLVGVQYWYLVLVFCLSSVGVQQYQHAVMSPALLVGVRLMAVCRALSTGVLVGCCWTFNILVRCVTSPRRWCIGFAMIPDLLSVVFWCSGCSLFSVNYWLWCWWPSVEPLVLGCW